MPHHAPETTVALQTSCRVQSKKGRTSVSYSIRSSVRGVRLRGEVLTSFGSESREKVRVTRDPANTVPPDPAAPLRPAWGRAPRCPLLSVR
jgi:hypothetical protein